MFDHFKQKLTKLRAGRRDRPNDARTRGMLERLEGRMMLSATYGDFGYNRPAPTSHAYGDVGPPPATSSAAYSSQPIAPRMVVSGSYSVSSVREVGYAYYDYQSYAVMQSALASPERVSASEQPWQRQPVWNQSFGMLPPRSELEFHSEAESSSVSRSVMPPTYTISIYYVEIVWAGPPATRAVSAPDSDAYPPPRLGLSQPGDSNGGIYLRPSLPIDRVLANAAFASDSTIASQTLLRETTTAGILNAVARDLAFQEFAPSLFQSNTAIAFDRMSLEAVGPEMIQADLNDGLADSSGEATNNVAMNSSDAVTREREAVDAVLDELEDVDSLMPASEPHAHSSNPERPVDKVLGVLEADEAEGGMVLLQSTGDANGNGLDLTPAYAEHVERLIAPAKMEASIGIFYQAMDIAADDAPLVEVGSQTSPSTQATREIKSADELPAKREQSSAGKAATLVGASTLTGALVWMNRGGRVVRQKTTAQKRRVVRG